MLNVELEKQHERILNAEQPSELPSPKFAMSLASPPDLDDSDSLECDGSGIIGSCDFERFEDPGQFIEDHTSSHMETVSVVESGVSKAVMELVVLEDMSHSLSDDLASLVDDSSVPVFFPKA